MPTTFPDFSTNYIKKADRELLNQLDKVDTEIKQYLTAPKQNNWDDVCQPLINLENNVLLQWSVISHLNNVSSSEEIRNLYEKCLPKVIDFQIKLNQNPELYHAIQKLDNHPSLSLVQKKAIVNSLKDFKLSGVHLPESKQQQLKVLQHALSDLQNNFSKNTIDSAKNWHYLIKNESELSGLPVKEKEALKVADGWEIGSNFHSYQVITKYADNRELREKTYYHYVTQCSEHDKKEQDNTLIMEEILTKRQAVADLLAFDDYLDLSLFNKMAESKQKVHSFLNDLIKKVKPLAEEEWKELTAFAKDTGFKETLQAWDVAYFSNLLKEKKFNYNEEALREYFPLPKVLNGLFFIVQQLFGIEIKEESESVSTWHSDVRFFSIYKDSELVGHFYLDIYARANKRSGAWMDECKIRSKVSHTELQLPIAYLICNFNKPKNNNPTLLYHTEVVTLFHEFGHTLHHLLTQIDVMPVAGIQGVPWDAVEVPSQFLENWSWQPEIMPYISEHYSTQKALPDSLLQVMIKAKNFQAGMKLMRQLEFALFDYKLHEKRSKPNSVKEILNEVRNTTAIYPTPSYNCFPNTFNHVFAGGYAAGYYSYLWAEVIACDLFSIFKQKGLLSSEIGEQFLNTYLGQGGSQCPSDLFNQFSGRDFSLEPFLHHHALN